jgi:ADP-heptose:LPS heptosyltransferase
MLNYLEPKTQMFWDDDVKKRKVRLISPTKMRAMGLSTETLKFVDTLDQLRKNPPNIVIAKSLKTFKFVQNWFKNQELRKNVEYVMGLGVFQQMFQGTIPGAKQKFLKPSNIKFYNMYSPYLGQPLDDKTLLVFRTGGIGDLLFIQPNLRYLKEKYRSCTINFACGPQYQSMVENWDYVDNVIDLPFPLKWLREADYHVLFEGVIERCKEAHSTNAYRLFTRWMGLDLPDELLVPSQDAKEDKLDECKEILKNWGILGEPFILAQLRASSPVRTPRPDFWWKIINSLTDMGFNILLTDNPKQAEYVDKFIKNVKNKDKVFNFCQHSTSIDYTIAVTKLASLVLATDSALNHIGASLGIPCYGIYGPFPGFIRLETYPKARWIDAKKSCAPCFLHGQSSCPAAGKDHFSPCYDNIDITRVVQEIGEMING